MSITLRWTFIESKLILETNHPQSFLLTFLKSGWRCISVLLTSVHCHTHKVLSPSDMPTWLLLASITSSTTSQTGFLSTVRHYSIPTLSLKGTLKHFLTLIFTSKWVTFNFKLEVVSVFITTIDPNLNFVINEPPSSSENHVNTVKACRFKPKCERLLCFSSSAEVKMSFILHISVLRCQQQSVERSVTSCLRHICVELKCVVLCKHVRQQIYNMKWKPVNFSIQNTDVLFLFLFFWLTFCDFLEQVKWFILEFIFFKWNVYWK